MVPDEPPAWARRDDGAGTDGGPSGQVAREAREAGQQVVAEAKVAAAGVASEAKDAGRQMAGDARRAAEEQIDQRSTMAGERVGIAAEDARDIAEHLRGRGREAPAKLADQAADRMERFARYLQDADADRIMSDVRRVGRERPGALVAGAAVVGVLIGRVVKASEPATTPSQGSRSMEGVR
jgi:hypothetical protein